MQSLIGSCTRDEIACRLATRVIGHKPANNAMLIDCGFLAISYDGMKLNPNDFATFTDDPDLTYVNIIIFIVIYQTLPGPGWLNELGLPSNSYKPIANTAWVLHYKKGCI